MKIFIGIFPILIICLIAFKLGFRSERGLEKLAVDFKAANQAATIEPMLELYCLDGSDELSIKHLKRAIQYELGLTIKKIEFEPLFGAPEETIQFTHNGNQYGPTLEPRCKMRVTYEGKDRFTSLYTVGKTNSGIWRFISAKPI